MRISNYRDYLAMAASQSPADARPLTTQDVATAHALGIHWLKRFPAPETLRAVLSNRLYPELTQWQWPRPVAVVLYPRADSNGAFVNSPVTDLMRGHLVLYYEVGNEAEVAAALKDASRAGPASLLYVGGHGTKDRVLLGHDAQDSSQSIDLVDEGALTALLRPALAAGGVVVVDSCSTGEGGSAASNVATMFARAAPQAHVFAPTVPTSNRTRPWVDPWGRFLGPGFVDVAGRTAPAVYIPPAALQASRVSAQVLFGI